MLKKDLVEIYMKEKGLHFKEEAKRDIEVFLESMKKALTKDDVLILRGFGTFEVITNKRTEGRNPRTGETIQITPKRKIKFSVGNNLKERITKARYKKKKK